MEITLKEAIELLRKWSQERPERAKYPRAPDNPHGDNTTGMAFDEGWWSCLKWGKMKGYFPEGER